MSTSSFQSRLTFIMETITKSAFSQVCELVDEDSAAMHKELSRLLLANSVLVEKVNDLECQLTIIKSPPSYLEKSSRSVAVQTDSRDEEAHCVAGSVAIEGIFGNEWCMNLWKDRDPYDGQRCAESSLPSEKSVTSLTSHILVPGIKEEDYQLEATTFSGQQKSISDEYEEDTTAKPEELMENFSVDTGIYNLSFGQDREHGLSAVGNEGPAEKVMSVQSSEESFGTHMIPVEEDEDNDNLQFVQAINQEPSDDPTVNTSRDNLQPISLDCTVAELEMYDNSNGLNAESTQSLNTDEFACEICGRTFFHKGTLTRHMNTHKLNFCNICKQQFPRKNKLNSHNCVAAVPTQKGSKSCKLCGKTFANPSALKIHYVVHTGEKPYRCSLCGKRFTQKGNLKCHLRIHTGERPFLCVKCGRTFTQKVNLNHHLLSHLNHVAGKNS